MSNRSDNVIPCARDFPRDDPQAILEIAKQEAEGWEQCVVVWKNKNHDYGIYASHMRPTEILGLIEASKMIAVEKHILKGD
jgi:hypothetical protein